MPVLPSGFSSKCVFGKVCMYVSLLLLIFRMCVKYIYISKDYIMKLPISSSFFVNISIVLLIYL